MYYTADEIVEKHFQRGGGLEIFGVLKALLHVCRIRYVFYYDD
jgi:hypothetical protein